MDYDLLLKLAFHYPFDFVNEVLAFYRIHENTLSAEYENIYGECRDILKYWEKHPSCKTPLRSKLIKKSIARTYYIIGVHSMVSSRDVDKARNNLIKSWKIVPTLKTMIFLLLSFVNLKQVDFIMLWIKKYTGRGIITR